MLDKDNQILLSELKDVRRLGVELRRKVNSLEVAVWGTIFLSFVILLALMILIIMGENNG